MAKKSFDFQSESQLILANLPTVRKIQKALDQGPFRDDLKAFLKHINSRLKEAIPQMDNWDTRPKDFALYLHPAKKWRVVSDDYIALTFDMKQCVEPKSYDHEDDPYVGLYIPRQWKQLQSFTDGLKGLPVKGFEHLNDREDREELDESIPIWSTIHLQSILKRGKLDIEGLDQEIIDRVRRLVLKEDLISELIAKQRGLKSRSK